MNTQRQLGSLITAVLICVVSVAIPWSPAGAISEEDLERKIKVIRGLTKAGALDSLEEKRQIAIAKKMYQDEQKDQKVSAVGEAFIDGLSPTAFSPVGAMVNLTFQFVDPATDLPTTGPPIASVEYLVNLDPDNDLFSILGTSTDASSHFSLPFTVVPFEPFIKSLPLDSNGNVIVITGVDGDNDAVGVAVVLEPAPEPSTIMLIGSGGVIVLAFVWCRRRHNRHGLGQYSPRQRSTIAVPSAQS
jgi:PEP-CTERM motif